MANNKKKEKEKEKGAPAATAAAIRGRAHPLCAGRGEDLTQGSDGRGVTAEEQDEQGAYGELPHQGGHTR